MANYVNSPNMSLPIPSIGVDPGPDYAVNINNALTTLDGHNHSPGSGVQINPSGLNINTALSMQNNSLINVGSVVMTALTSAPSVSNSLFVQNGTESPTPRPDLWYYDGTTAVQITSNGSVIAAVTSIPGESYSSGTFTWRQGSGSTVPANFDIGSVIIRPNTAGTTNGVTLNPPSGISSAYSLALPTIPTATSLVTIDTSGNIAAQTVVDNSTIVISSNTIQVPSQGITATQIANATITSTQLATSAVATANIANNAVTPAKLASFNSSVSSSSGTVTTSSATPSQVPNQSLSITTHGRPVMLMCLPSGTSASSAGALSAEANSVLGSFQWYRNGSPIANFSIACAATGGVQVPCGVINYIDQGVGAGTYTYQLYWSNITGSGNLGALGIYITAYEL